MKITIKSKLNNQLSGSITTSDITRGVKIDLMYQGKPEVIKEIQKVLLKYYYLRRIGGGGGSRISKLLLPEVTSEKEEEGEMKNKNKIHILFMSLWIIEFIVSMIGAVRNNNYLWIGGMIATVLTLILCIGLQIKYDDSDKTANGN